jgi:hypothetical protein
MPPELGAGGGVMPTPFDLVHEQVD